MASTAEDEALPEGVSLEDISSLPLIRKLKSDTVAFADGFIRIQPYNQVFPYCMKNYLKQISGFEVKENDIWISSFPKCGTTWTQELVWCLKHQLDLTQAKAKLLDERVPFLEATAITPAITKDNSITDVDKLPSPRIIKTHLIFEMLPKQCMEKPIKLIYVTRNPRDACVSFYNHWKLLEAYTGSFEDFAELFLNDMCGFYTPFITHVLSYWNQRLLPHVLFITFEEMKEDLPAVIKKMAYFLGENITNDDVMTLENHLSFDNMKKNAAVNKQEYAQFLHELYNEQYGKEEAPPKGEFMRKGKVGNWKEHFSNDLLQRFIQWENKGLENSAFKFVFE